MDKINKMAKAMNVTLPQNYADILVKDNETALNVRAMSFYIYELCMINNRMVFESF